MLEALKRVPHRALSAFRGALARHLVDQLEEYIVEAITDEHGGHESVEVEGRSSTIYVNTEVYVAVLIAVRKRILNENCLIRERLI